MYKKQVAGTQPKINTPESPDASLSAGDIRETTGLSYRQLNEWDKRDSLPHERKGKSGWRKFTPLQAMALKILSAINQEFGTPLVKQQKLLSWMLGEAPTILEQLRLMKAEDILYGFTDEEIDESNRDIAERIKQGKIKIKEHKGVTFGDETIQYKVDNAQIQGMIELMAQSVIPYLVRRGWDKDEAESFAKRFYAISIGQKYGQKNASEILALGKEAKDWPSKLAVQVLGSAVCPILSMMGMMTSGVRVYLVTNLKEKYFMTETGLMDLVKIHGLPQPAIILGVNDYVNIIMQATGKKAIPLKIEPSAIEQSQTESLSKQEQKVLKLLRDKKFDRLIVESKDNAYRIELERNVSVEDGKKIGALIEEHDYQSVTVKKQNGKIVRILQSVSMKMDTPTVTEKI